jgi:hypothetical protein
MENSLKINSKPRSRQVYAVDYKRSRGLENREGHEDAFKGYNKSL